MEIIKMSMLAMKQEKENADDKSEQLESDLRAEKVKEERVSRPIHCLILWCSVISMFCDFYVL